MSKKYELPILRALKRANFEDEQHHAQKIKSRKDSPAPGHTGARMRATDVKLHMLLLGLLALNLMKYYQTAMYNSNLIELLSDMLMKDMLTSRWIQRFIQAKHVVCRM